MTEFITRGIQKIGEFTQTVADGANKITDNFTTDKTEKSGMIDTVSGFFSGGGKRRHKSRKSRKLRKSRKSRKYRK